MFLLYPILRLFGNLDHCLGEHSLIKKPKYFAAAIFVLILGTGAVIAGVSNETAKRFISDITENASFILMPDEQMLEEREKEFHSFLKQNFDFSFISALVMGNYWNQMSDEQRSEFIGLFSDFFLKSYASQFGGYPGEKSVIRQVQRNSTTDAFVKLSLYRPKRKPANSEWRIREFAGIPRIIDLKVSGVSVVISHKKGFHRHMERKGVEGLLTLLRIRAERLSAQQ